MSEVTQIFRENGWAIPDPSLRKEIDWDFNPLGPISCHFHVGTRALGKVKLIQDGPDGEPMEIGRLCLCGKCSLLSAQELWGKLIKKRKGKS